MLLAPNRSKIHPVPHKSHLRALERAKQVKRKRHLECFDGGKTSARARCSITAASSRIANAHVSAAKSSANNTLSSSHEVSQSSPLNSQSKFHTVHEISPLVPSLTLGIISLEHELSANVSSFIHEFASESDLDAPNVKQVSVPEVGSHKILLRCINISNKRDYEVWSELHGLDLFVMMYNSNDWVSFAKTTKYLKRIAQYGEVGVLVGVEVPEESQLPSLTVKQTGSLPRGSDVIGSSDSVDTAHSVRMVQQFQERFTANSAAGASGRVNCVTEADSTRKQRERQAVTASQVQCVKRRFPENVLQCLQLGGEGNDASTQYLVESVMRVIAEQSARRFRSEHKRDFEEDSMRVELDEQDYPALRKCTPTWQLSDETTSVTSKCGYRWKCNWLTRLVPPLRGFPCVR